MYQPALDTNATTSMWHYVIRVNRVTVYRIIQLNYFNITKPAAIPFPPSSKKFQWKKVSMNVSIVIRNT